MSISTTQKLALAARVAARITADRARKSRLLAAAWRGARVTAVSLGRVLSILWLEVTGFVFLALAGIGGLAFAREYARYEAGKASLARLALAISFTLAFAWFGVSSFWRARRKL